MDLFDVFILVNVGVIALLFAFVAVLDWRDSRGNQQPDAQVIQHPQTDRRVNPAA